MRYDPAPQLTCVESVMEDNFGEDYACPDAHPPGSSSPPHEATPWDSFGRSCAPPSALALALSNKNRIRGFCRDVCFERLHAAETGLFISVLYVVVDGRGVVHHVGTSRPRNLHPDYTAARLLVLGSQHMFAAPRAARSFTYEIQELNRHLWTEEQQVVLSITQRLLNQSARWLRDGFSDIVITVPSSPVPTSPAHLSSPHSHLQQHQSHSHHQGSSQSSPPGHSPHFSTLLDRSPQTLRISPDLVAATADRVALCNLQQLERAQVLQESATLFVDGAGRLRHILFGRPRSEHVSFLGLETEDDEHLTVLRIHLSDARVDLHSPFEPLNAMQEAVVAGMQRLLNV